MGQDVVILGEGEAGCVVEVGVECVGGVEREMRSSSGIYWGSSSEMRVRLRGEVWGEGDERGEKTGERGGGVDCEGVGVV